MKRCKMCGRVLPPRRSKYCSPECQRAKNAKYAMEQRILKGDPTVGVGKGGSNKKFTDHKQYTSGMGNFHALRKQMREEILNCERCDKDLSEATRYHWCVHHMDRNRTNNVRENLEMLCKRCHQIEHDCASALNN